MNIRTHFLFALIGAMMIWPFTQAAAKAVTASAYDHSFETLVGQKPMPLSQFKGKVLLMVNTASKCGFTTQYEGLQKLYDTYRDRGLVVVGVPSDDFGGQEPGSGQEIAEFCKLNYGVTFPMTSKTVVSGDKAHPFYQLASNALGLGTAPKWNFHKYLVDRNGKIVDHFNSMTAPDSSKLIAAIEMLLAKPAN